MKGRCFWEKHQESIKYPKNFKGSKKIKRPKDDERYTHNFKSQLVKKLTLCLLSPACSSASDPSADALLLQPQGILPFQSASSSHIDGWKITHIPNHHPVVSSLCSKFVHCTYTRYPGFFWDHTANLKPRILTNGTVQFWQKGLEKKQTLELGVAPTSFLHGEDRFIKISSACLQPYPHHDPLSFYYIFQQENPSLFTKKPSFATKNWIQVKTGIIWSKGHPFSGIHTHRCLILRTKSGFPILVSKNSIIPVAEK